MKRSREDEAMRKSTDPLAWLAYADWLEETGEGGSARFWRRMGEWAAFFFPEIERGRHGWRPPRFLPLPHRELPPFRLLIRRTPRRICLVVMHPKSLSNWRIYLPVRRTDAEYFSPTYLRQRLLELCKAVPLLTD